MPPKIDLIGKKFGRWDVISLASYTNEQRRRPCYLCRCECGVEKVINGRELRDGKSRSCGCLKRERLSKRTRTHGLSKHKLYWVWKSLISRCTKESHPQYKDYGARGVFVCAEWVNDYTSFYKWAINNGYKEGLSIDRENNDGGYEPNNCRWATNAQQVRNRRVTKRILFFGEYWCVGEISEVFNLNKSRLIDRVYKGWDIYDAAFERKTKRNNLWD